MSYSVTCGCGATHPVSATLAGATLRCGCGRSLDVPVLSALRKSAGESPIPLNTIELIRAMIRNDELPGGDACPYSGRAADDTIYFQVQCERLSTPGGWSALVVVWGLLFGWLAALMAFREEMKPRDAVGRDTCLEIPLRISSDVRSRVARTRRQKTLKMLLRKTPIYATLLDEFPEARVTPLA